MAWEKVKIVNEHGEQHEAIAPVIISASRSTDIPTFYSDWFFYRLKKGYSAWINPFNGVKSYVSYKNTRIIVFWSKNPEPLLKHIDVLKEMGINCYIQFTLNDYVGNGLEQGVPKVDERIDTFKKLVDKLGFGKVIWRFDPLIQTDKIGIYELLNKMQYIGNHLNGYTEKLVFSFVDIKIYKKVQINLKKNKINYRDFTPTDMLQFAEELSILNKKWNYDLSTCGEEANYKQFGILPNKCIDDDLMIKYFSDDKKLMDFLGVEITKGDLFNHELKIIKHKGNQDKGQRKLCGCIISKDIGEYNSCAHLCEYCYANSSKEQAKANYQQHLNNPLSETITGK